MEQEAGFIRRQSNLILKLFNTLLEIEKTEKENLGPYGLHVLMQAQEL
jgi:hypothetical protein